MDYAVDETLSSWIQQDGGLVDGVELRYTHGSDGSVSRQLTITKDIKVSCTLHCCRQQECTRLVPLPHALS